jgi:hypothetical protein
MDHRFFVKIGITGANTGLRPSFSQSKIDIPKWNRIVTRTFFLYRLRGIKRAAYQVHRFDRPADRDTWLQRRAWY